MNVQTNKWMETHGWTGQKLANIMVLRSEGRGSFSLEDGHIVVLDGPGDGLERKAPPF